MWRAWLLIGLSLVLNLDVIAQERPPSVSNGTTMLPTNEAECLALRTTASSIASNHEKGMPRQRLRTSYIKGFARDHGSPPVFSQFERATILHWLLDDLYGPSAFLSTGNYALLAREVWCRAALTTSRPEHIRFTLASLTPDLIDAIRKCLLHPEFGQSLVRLRDRGFSLADTTMIFKTAILQAVDSSQPRHPQKDILANIEQSRHRLAENLRVVTYVAAAIYADLSLAEATVLSHMPRLCTEISIP